MRKISKINSINLDPLTLECFLAVAETGGFTKATTRIGRTQSSISQKISKLENLLECTLFARGRRLTLTPQGEMLLTYARDILELHYKAIEHFKDQQLTGELRFGMPEDVASVFLADILYQFSQAHPHILLNIECDLTLNLFERFKKREFDLVLVKMSKPQDFAYGTNIWLESLEWVGATTNIKTQDVIPLVLSPQPCVYRAHALKALEKAKKKWRIVFSSHSYDGKIAAIKAGMGITVFPRNMIPRELSIIAKTKDLPHLKHTHVSLVKYENNNPLINSLERFVVNRLKFS